MKKGLIAAAVVVILAMAAVVVYLLMDNRSLEQEKLEMQELAELDKQEMENDYERLSLQYSEMMTQINNDSIIAQLTQEQMRTQQLLQELRNVKASDAREIARLKKELATVREDALAQSNQANEGLRQEKQNLTEKVAIAAQLDATGIQMQLLNKRQKTAKKIKDCKTILVNFTISRNVTAENGNRTLYVRIQTPAGQVLTAGWFPYENRQLEYSMKKVVEYAGEEVGVQTFWQVGEYLEAGQYRVSIFADGNMIGSKTFTFN